MPERNLSLRLGLALVAVVALLGLGAPWLAPYDAELQHDPPTGSNLPPGSRKIAVALADGRTLLADRLEKGAQHWVLERGGRRDEIPLASLVDARANAPHQTRRFLLGTDRYGRDLLSRLLFGARLSISIGILAAALSLALGTTIGSAAAVGGPWIDALLMRTADALMPFPRLFLLVSLAAILRPSTPLLILILGLTSWMPTARLVRAEMLSAAEKPFIAAARSLGLRPWTIFWKHLLPNSITPAISAGALSIGGAILSESTLSFLGLGVQPPEASWGNLIADGSTTLATTWWLSVFPGLALVSAVAGFNLVADGVRDALDPRLSGSRERPLDANA